METIMASKQNTSKSLGLGQKASKKEGKYSLSTKDNPFELTTATCVCGAVYNIYSTKKDIRVEICSKCHPFYTGDNRIIDTEGRVEKFKKKYQKKQS